MTQPTKEFKLKAEFIELDNLLKAMHVVASGAEAKNFIQANSVQVNGVIETRIRRKLTKGDCVELRDERILIL